MCPYYACGHFFIRDLMARKKRIFPHATHVISRYELQTTADDIHLFVWSLLNDPKKIS